MGGTLDNGIYLPDQGERNCYNGLKNNWDTLDNLIETVQALSSAGLTREIVNSLPTENIKTNVIYMLRNSQQSGDLYDEYMYINNAWEPIGTSATEMDNYYTKSETNALPAVASGITASKVTGYDSHVANTEVHITAAERSTWNGKQNALDTDQTAAVNSGVNATKVTEYDTHVADTVVHVTASDKTAWNAKQDGLSQAQLNAVNSGVTSAKVTGYDTHVGDTSAHVSSSDRTAWNGKQDALSQTQLDNIAAVPDKANSADLATVATTGDYGDLLNAPTIPTVNNASLTIQKNGTDVATFTANASSNVTANLSIPTDTSDLTNGAGFLTQHNPIDNELSVSSENAVQNKVVTTALNGKAASSHTHAAGDINTGTFNIARIPNLDASKITSGTIDIARLPKGSLERLVKVADQAARYALTTDDVQLGDTVQQLDTGVMYVVTDETKLDSADGYTEFTAGSATSVPWSGVTGKPSTFAPSSHTHGNITNDGRIGSTANLPLITGTSGTITTGSFGNTANTFCEGNDSRLSDARTPVAHTHTKSEITDFPTNVSAFTNDSGYANDNNVVHKSGNETISGDKAFTQTIRNKSEVLEIGVIPSSNIDIGYRVVDKNNTIAANLQYTQYTSGNSQLALNLRTKDSNNNAVNKSVLLNTDQYGTWFNFRPSDNGSISLGSTNYRWSAVYSDSYYYGTTAWGLDKENVWTNTNTFTAYVESIGSSAGGEYSSNTRTNFWLMSNRDTEEVSGILFDTYRQNTVQGTGIHILGIGIKENSVRYEGCRWGWYWDNNLNGYTFDFKPTTQGANQALKHNLGTSNDKWNTINGINPGALSLPDYAKSANIDTTNWNTTGTKIDYTPPENCLIQIVTHNESGNKITVLNKYTSPEWGNCVCGNGQGNNLFFEKLLEGGRTYYIYITDTNASPTVRARYIPLFGNV